MIFELLKFRIADCKGNIGDAQIYGRPHVTDDRYLAELEAEYRDTHARYLTLRSLVMDKIVHLVGTRNAMLTYDIAKNKTSELDEQVDILNEYLQSICPHDKLRFYTTGSVHLILGEAWDDIEEHAQCEFCGKEVVNGTNLQDDTSAEF